ncbi:MAG: hypothetical protein PVJ44_23645, partial [Desulfobacterales bacterium]
LLPLFWRQKFFSKISVWGCMLPLFLLPVVWQRLLYLNHPETNKIGNNLFQRVDAPFSLKSLIQHLDDNIYVLLGIDPNWGFSIILSGLGLIGIYLMGKNLVLKKDIHLENSVLIAGITSFVGLLMIISAFFWGKFTTPMDNRLALVFTPFIVWSSIYGVYRIGQHIKRQAVAALTIVFVFHLLFFWPIGAAQRVANTMALPYEYQNALAYLKAHYPNPSNTLILTEHPNMYVIHKYSAYRISSIDKMLAALPDTTIEQIVALQSFDLKSGKIAARSRLNGSLETIRVAEIRISPYSGVKISECRHKPDMDNFDEKKAIPKKEKQL